MKYAVLKIVNGSFSIDSEWSDTNLNSAIVQWHNVCGTLWNSADVKTATVKIINENGLQVEGYTETVFHEVNE